MSLQSVDLSHYFPTTIYTLRQGSNKNQMFKNGTWN